jgi:hypothetical protein
MPIPITSFAGLIANSTIKCSDFEEDTPASEKDGYLLELLRENYREIVFYYRQMKRGRSDAYQRLQACFKAFAGTIRGTSEELANRFYQSIGDQQEILLFIQQNLEEDVKDVSHCVNY